LCDSKEEAEEKCENDKMTETLTLTCAGDFLPADSDYSLGKGIGSKIQDLLKANSRQKADVLPKCDIFFCNLESPLSKDSGKELPFLGKAESLGLFDQNRMNIVSVANNHILDHGEKAFHETLDILRGKNIHFTGVKTEKDSAHLLLKVKDTSLGFAAFNGIHDKDDRNLVAGLDEETLFSTLDELKKISPDHIIFSLHWGNEYVEIPSPEQTELARRLIDKGVSVIIGHHPHVVQAVETYNGGLIIYSLGNYLFDSFWSERVRNGMEMDIFLKAGKEPEYRIRPFRIRKDFTRDYSGGKRVIKYLSASENRLKELREVSENIYRDNYAEECRKQRLKARIRMKLYLASHFFSLSRSSREILFANSFRKILPVGK
jgi:gamma-polyglutamate biosynthesis protein CapA